MFAGESLNIMKQNKSKLLVQAISKFFFGLLLIAMLLFLPAGEWHYWNAWLFLCVLFVPILILGIVMFIFSPKLLEKRLNTKEQEKAQKMVVAMSGLLFVVAFILSGFNYRFGWHQLPSWVVWVSSSVFLLSYLMYAEVLRENAYLSRRIEVQENQRIIDDGLYRIVRHPMYMATLFLFLSMPLILGSLISFFVLLLYVPLLVIRIKNEEKFLEKNLDGYLLYKQKVKYRLLPFVW